MNMSRLLKPKVRYLLWGALLLFAGIELRAQTGGVEFVSLEVVLGETLTYDFYSQPPYSPQIDQYGVYPMYGTADLPGPGPLGVPGENTLTYTPTTIVPAIDTVFIKYWVWQNNNYTTVDLTLEILVKPSIVHAVDDYTETMEGTPVIIDVLANDWTNGQTLGIADVPLVNNGTFTLNSDSTMLGFIPAPGFSGVANLNYTICDDAGTCDMAVVTVGVMPNVMQVEDSIVLTTPKETERSILVNLDGFTLISGPDNGSIDFASADYPIYTPDPGFYNGYDEVIFEKVDGGTTYTVNVIFHVLDIDAPNTFVVDDEAHTPKEEPVVIKVLNNDLGGDNLNNVSIYSQPGSGSVTTLAQGVFEYTPNPGFFGIDEFVYRAFSPDLSVVEYGTVFVNVSNHIPTQNTFELATPKYVPLVLGYNVPIYAYNFSVTVDPDYGTVEYLSGTQTVTRNGQTFTGYNMLIYTPDSTLAVPGLVDKFEIEYCVVNDNCPTAEVKIDIEILDIDVTPDQFCLGENCVWAGDTNVDGVVDMKDILPLGLSMGEVGIQRPNPDLSQWYGQFGEDWNNIFSPASDYDLKHIDSDGNGIIGATDTAAISQFYLNEHTITAERTGPQIDVPLYFYQQEVIPVDEGDLVKLDIWLGDPNDVIAEDIYGFTFSLDYDPEFVIEESVKIDFLSESWLAYNSPILHMTKKPGPGFIDAGFTRTGGYSDTGYGIVAEMEFIIVEDLEGGRLNDGFLDLELHDVTAMNSGGQTFSLPSSSLRIPIRLNGEEDEPAEGKLMTSPNPAQDFVNIHLNGKGHYIESLAVYSITGATVQQFNHLEVKNKVLDTRNWVSGLYIVQVVSTNGEVFTSKVEITK